MKKTGVMIALLTLAHFSYGQNIHTWHHIKSKNGHWLGRLVMASADEGGYFIKKGSDKKRLLLDFELDSLNNDYVFGFGFDMATTDFDVSYTLTLYEKNNAQFTSKACVFNVGAVGPARADVRFNAYNGAVCNYSIVPGVGVDFDVA